MPDIEERKIRVIDSSVDLEIDDRPPVPGGDAGTKIDTSDATAFAEDLLKGKTAYARGEKLIGRLEPLDPSDATATAEDIRSGKFAYGEGGKINGTLDVPQITEEEYQEALDLTQDILGI